MNFRRDFEQLLEKNKIVRYIFIVFASIIFIIFFVGLFSWDSFVSWIVTKEKSDLYGFIFWVIFAIITLIASIAIAILFNRNKE